MEHSTRRTDRLRKLIASHVLQVPSALPAEVLPCYPVQHVPSAHSIRALAKRAARPVQRERVETSLEPTPQRRVFHVQQAATTFSQDKPSAAFVPLVSTIRTLAPRRSQVVRIALWEVTTKCSARQRAPCAQVDRSATRQAARRAVYAPTTHSARSPVLSLLLAVLFVLPATSEMGLDSPRAQRALQDHTILIQVALALCAHLARLAQTPQPRLSATACNAVQERSRARARLLACRALPVPSTLVMAKRNAPSALQGLSTRVLPHYLWQHVCLVQQDLSALRQEPTRLVPACYAQLGHTASRPARLRVLRAQEDPTASTLARHLQLAARSVPQEPSIPTTRQRQRLPACSVLLDRTVRPLGSPHAPCAQLVHFATLLAQTRHQHAVHVQLGPSARQMG